MPGAGFWIGIAVDVAIIGVLTWIGGAFVRRSRTDDWAERQDRPFIPTPPWGDDDY